MINSQQPTGKCLMSSSILDLFRLDGKTALVTGGSRGLGREIALAFADAGANLVLIGRTAESLERTATEIRQRGSEVHTIVADIADEATCERTANAALTAVGGIDILVNNVGGRSPNTTIAETTAEQWNEALALNLNHCFLMTRIIGGAMIDRSQGGRIINIGSISGMIVNRDVAGRHYEASKAALIHFTRTVAVDWALVGIQANSISPGLFMTDANMGWKKRAPQTIDSFVAGVPMGRTGEPREIAPLALYLASPASSYVTGANFVIDGGYTAW